MPAKHKFGQKPASCCSVVRCSMAALIAAPIGVLLLTILRPPEHRSAVDLHPTTVPPPPSRAASAVEGAAGSEPAVPVRQVSPEPVVAGRMLKKNESAWDRKHGLIGSEPMDGDWMLDCPPTPPEGYPKHYPIMDIINNWPPDRPTPIAPKHYHSLCRFDYTKDLEKAIAYRDAEVPFIVYNNPSAEEIVTKWNTDGYLEKLLGKERFRTEVSHNNHFMYYSGGSSRGKGNKAWRAPTSNEKLSFEQFKAAALRCEAKNCSAEEKHYYFRVTASYPSHYIFKELPFFQPKPHLFIKDPKGQRGIHCRFGMSAVIAENHYDGSRNVIGIFGGRRRYILSHPKECDNMYLLPMGHPSGRHSGDACNYHPDCKDSPTSVDYSQPDLKRFPKFKELQANEVILSPGDFLYLPTHWFHYIISLGLNYQCNTRSGRGNEYTRVMRKCGFS